MRSTAFEPIRKKSRIELAVLLRKHVNWGESASSRQRKSFQNRQGNMILGCKHDIVRLCQTQTHVYIHTHSRELQAMEPGVGLQALAAIADRHAWSICLYPSPPPYPSRTFYSKFPVSRGSTGRRQDSSNPSHRISPTCTHTHHHTPDPQVTESRLGFRTWPLLHEAAEKPVHVGAGWQQSLAWQVEDAQ